MDEAVGDLDILFRYKSNVASVDAVLLHVVLCRVSSVGAVSATVSGEKAQTNYGYKNSLNEQCRRGGTNYGIHLND